MQTTASLPKLKRRRRDVLRETRKTRCAPAPRARKGPAPAPAPLTPDGQALVLVHLDLAGRVAAWQAARAPRMYWEFHSAALLGLVEAAARYDPALGVSFRQFAQGRVLGAVLDCRRARRPRGFRRRRGPCEFSLDEPLSGPEGDSEDDTLASLVPSTEGPVGWELESLDAVEYLASHATGRQREAVLLRFARCATVGQEATAQALGVTRSGVSRLVNIAFRWIREGERLL